MNILSHFHTLQPTVIYLGVVALIVLTLSAALTTHFCLSARRARVQTERVRTMLQLLRHGESLETNLERILEFIATLFTAHTFSFYIYDEKHRNFILKAVRQAARDFGSIKPSYSGLMEYQHETYHPPLALGLDSFPPKPSIQTDGDVPLFVIPFPAQQAVIRFGPMKQGISSKQIEELAQVSRDLSPIVHEFIVVDKQRRQVNSAVSSGQAIHTISGLAMNPSLTADMVLHACVRNVGADSGILLECDPLPRIVAFCNVDERWLGQFEDDATALTTLTETTGRNRAVVLRRGQQEFHLVPKQIAESGVNSVVVHRVGERREFIMWGRNEVPALTNTSVEQIDSLAIQLDDLARHQVEVLRGTKDYVDVLKHLAVITDHLNSDTVGYSDLMQRYAIVISKQLGLPDDEIRDVALAAFLSNIGVLGLSSELFYTTGQYSESEFEMMKLHAEVGADIIQMTTGNHRVASFVRFHHERFDGHGYPEGRVGNEIPLGARILAVVQVFLAKINRRGLRDALPLEMTLEMLKAARGNQLDGQIVDALIAWLDTRSHFMKAK